MRKKVSFRSTRWGMTCKQAEWGREGCSAPGGEAPGLVAGPSPCDLQEAGGHRLTRHRHRKTGSGTGKKYNTGLSQSYSPPGSPPR